MKNLMQIIFTRLKSKNPKFFTYLSYVAASIAVIFFSSDMIFDLSPYLSESVLNMIYTACITIAAIGQLPVSSESKNINKVK